ncbi:phosphotransferase [Paenibacillus sp. PR3]|uniref:Phosphotransferase n=1 Tax=Paenibacillus terricola TaxID=2763503 RepID=A0ABR8MVH9_9BACL|nr:aminoglycoside phosphotransferase family protein [Paenibacillus terricola]MBD3919012.1 phosphotransferase [Paenibacillus terricola]
MRKISEGRTAEVFAHDQDKILKLYRDGFPADAVNYEFEVNRIAAILGIPAPRAFELVELEHKKGIVFERVEGSTLLHRSVQYPNELIRLAREFADLHYCIHKHEIDVERVEGSSILNQKEVLARNIRNASELSNEMKVEIIDYLRSLPDGNRLCHGDFHPDNVMIGDRNWVIDWMTGMIGNPAGDVARTLLLFRYGTLPDEAPSIVKDALEWMREKINKEYLEQYLTHSGLQLRDIDDWMLPIAAARLTEWIPNEEKTLLLNLIAERLK